MAAKPLCSRGGLALAVAVGLSLIASACSSGSNGGTGTGSGSAGPANVTLWSWAPDLQSEVNVCQKADPKIHITLVNAGTGAPEYQKLRTAMRADSGVPDLVQLAYAEVPGFVATNSLADISKLGANSLKADYTAAAWANVSDGSKVYGLPWDSGPMAILYREDILSKYHIAVPTTWAAFAQAAVALHKADPGAYLTAFTPNEPLWFEALMWQAGSRPFIVSGKKLTVAINDAAAMKVANYWDQLIRTGALSIQPDYTTDWYTDLDNGTLASWVTAAWGPSFLQGVAGKSTGLWRAAPLPQWTAGATASSEYGGSTIAIPAQSKNQAAAYTVLKCLLNGNTSTVMFTTKQLLFPSKKSILNSASFTGEKSAFYGDTPVNQIFVQASADVVPGWEWSPIQDYVSQQLTAEISASAAKGDIASALNQVQAQVVAYAKQQGFQVTSG